MPRWAEALRADLTRRLSPAGTGGGRNRPLQLLVVGVAMLILLVSALQYTPRPDGSAVRTTTDAATPAAIVATPLGATDTDWGGALADITLKLLVVLLLAYLALAALRRYSFGAGLNRAGGAVQILETSTLAPNRVVYLVKAGDKTLLLGVTPQQITTLAEWPDGRSPLPAAADAAEPVAERAERAPASLGSRRG